MKTCYVNGKIFTARNNEEFISQFLVEDGVIKQTGDFEIPSDAEIVDLKGKTVIPGLSDPHVHPTYVADIIDSLACTPPNVHNIDEMIEFLKTSPEYGKGEDVWIKGWCYDESRLAEGRTPTIEDLDKVSKDQPVFVLRSDCHSSICNSKALEKAGVDKNTKDPAGGKIGRFEDGRPNGVMFDLSATKLILDSMGEASMERDADKMVALSKHYAKLGVVNLSEMMAFSEPYRYIDMYRLAEKKGFKQRISIYNMWEDIKGKSGIDEADKTGRVKIAGIKFFIDGTVSSKSAYVSEDYKGCNGEKGSLVHSREEMQEAIDWARKHKVQIALHVMGDAGIQEILDYTKDFDNWMPGEIPSVRIEHATMVTKEQCEIIKKSNVVYSISTQPIFAYAEYEGYQGALEDKRLKNVYPIKTIKEYMPNDITLSTDAPATIHPEPENLFATIKAAVRRKTFDGIEYNTDEEISVEEAIILASKNSKNTLCLENACSIEVGNAADFVVLTEDIFTIEKENIDKIKVYETYISGEKVYELK